MPDNDSTTRRDHERYTEKPFNQDMANIVKALYKSWKTCRNETERSIFFISMGLCYVAMHRGPFTEWITETDCQRYFVCHLDDSDVDKWAIRYARKGAR